MEKKRLSKITAVAQNVLDECVRHKILNVLFVFAVALIGGAFIIKELSPGAEKRTLIDAGYANIELFGFLTLILAVFIITFEEFEMRNIWITLTKPISRASYITGKFFGICSMLLLNTAVMFIILMGLCLLYGINLDPNYFIIVTAIFFSLVMSAAVFLLFSVVSTNLATGIIFSSFVFLIGHLTELLKPLINGDKTAPYLKVILSIVYWILPNLTFFNLKDRIYSVDGTFSLVYLAKILVYAVIYTSAVLYITAKSFERKEI